MVHSTEVATHLTGEQLDAGLDHIRQSPSDSGTLLMIVSRPDVGRREVLTECRLDVEEGVVGDSWKDRGSTSTPDGGRGP